MARLGEIIFFIGLLQPLATVPLIIYLSDIRKPARLLIALMVAGFLFLILTRTGIQIMFSNVVLGI